MGAAHPGRPAEDVEKVEAEIVALEREISCLESQARRLHRDAEADEEAAARPLGARELEDLRSSRAHLEGLCRSLERAAMDAEDDLARKVRSAQEEERGARAAEARADAAERRLAALEQSLGRPGSRER